MHAINLCGYQQGFETIKLTVSYCSSAQEASKLIAEDRIYITLSTRRIKEMFIEGNPDVVWIYKIELM